MVCFTTPFPRSPRYRVTVLDREGDTHLYIQIADAIRRRILAGRLALGDAVPSETELRSEFGVARTTARRAVRVLRDEGLIHTAQGEGTFVGPAGQTRRNPRRAALYQEIAKGLVRRIRRGDLKPRRPIPSESTLMHQYGVARETARRAVGLLREQGWVYTVPHRGTYVSQPEEWPDSAKLPPPVTEAERERALASTEGIGPILDELWAEGR